MKIKKVELEITSDCNAACPGCARTLNKNLLKINSFGLEELQDTFPPADYSGMEFKFCGVLGDPAMNEDCVAMVEYLSSHGAYCELSTNGGIQPVEWWSKLGKIASTRPGLVHVHFCIDGHQETNHIYRVNTKFQTVERNIKAYADAAPAEHATWIYIVFDHNEHELDAAKVHAKQLGFCFATRTGMRNSYDTWLAQLQHKENKKIVKETKKITTTGDKQHSKISAVEELDQFIKNYKRNTNNDKQKQAVINSIVCKYIHEGEIFIANDMTMWPCCFLWDSAFKNREGIVEKLQIFEPNWNSLRHHTIQEIQQHPWYRELLEASWDPDHALHFNKCIKTCAAHKAYHNEINYINS